MGNMCLEPGEKPSRRGQARIKRLSYLSNQKDGEQGENEQNGKESKGYRNKRNFRQSSTANLEESQSEGNYKNSFAKQNGIGMYFCGGSSMEKDAMSYPKRLENFQGVVQKCVTMQIEEEESQFSQDNQSEVRKRFSTKKIHEDMEEAFHHQFSFLPDLLALQPKLLQNSIKKGLPIKFRWVSWKSHLYSVSHSYLSLRKTKVLFGNLQLLASKEEVQIEKDITRTFPSQAFFSSKGAISSGSNSNSPSPVSPIIGYLPLKRVLIGISNMYPDLGYCQGMNFILGFILLINGANEPEAFWMFKVLAEHPDFMIMGLYETQLPFLGFLEYLTKKVLADKQPRLLEHFEEQDIQDSFWMTKWFLTFFLYNFPVKLCSRFWDFLITSDIFSLVRLTVAILDVFKIRFLEGDATTFMECFSKLTQDEAEMMNPKSPLYVPISDIIRKADGIKLSKKTIAKYASHFLTHKNPKNQYAQLYSLYDKPTEFKDFHQQLLDIKVADLSVFQKSLQYQGEAQRTSFSSQQKEKENENNSNNNKQENPESEQRRITEKLSDTLKENHNGTQIISENEQHDHADDDLNHLHEKTDSMLCKNITEQESEDELVEEGTEFVENDEDGDNDCTTPKRDSEKKQNNQGDKNHIEVSGDQQEEERDLISSGMPHEQHPRIALQARNASHQGTIEFDKESFIMFQSLKLKGTGSLLLENKYNNNNQYLVDQNPNNNFKVSNSKRLSPPCSPKNIKNSLNEHIHGAISSSSSSPHLSQSSGDDDYIEVYHELSVSYHDLPFKEHARISLLDSTKESNSKNKNNLILNNLHEVRETNEELREQDNHQLSEKEKEILQYQIS